MLHAGSHRRSLVLAVILALSFSMGLASTAGGDQPLDARLPPEKPAHTTIGPGQSRERLHLKLQEGSGVRLRDGTFVSTTGRDVAALRGVLSQYPGTQVERMFSRSEAELAADERRLEAKTGKDLADLNLWYRLAIRPGADPEAIIDGLNSLDIVEIAYPEPLPAPPPSTPDYENQQGYLDSAPDGIGARVAWLLSGGRGAGIKIIDVEYAWNTSHEDLSKAASALIPNGTPAVPNWPGIEDDLLYAQNHGAAVLGEIVADRNGFGVTGIAYESDLGLVNVYNVEDWYDLADAIDLARTNTEAGDVLLIEQQISGPAAPCGYPDYPYVPVEYCQAYFDAIQTATANDRVVVEAAGNGGCNLDDATYGGLFDRTVRDSGAIIVGAGAAPGCTAPPRSRLYFSTYGSRVDLQGWGECVVTGGYGDLQGGATPDEWYTDAFGGTSSASPIVAGAAAAVQGHTLATSGDVLTPAQIRQHLVATGTPQDDSVSGHIGPLPDLARSTLLFTLDTPNPQAAARFGWSVTVGDVNGDGKRDIVVGASHEDVGGNADQGRAYVFSGADGSLLLTLNNPNPQQYPYFGGSVAAGDVNGDGKADIAVGAYYENVGSNSNQGRAYVFSGADGSLLFTLDTPNPQGDAWFGYSLAVGDVNSDGKGDIAVGAHGANVGGNDEQGRAYVFSGANGSLLFTLDTPNPQADANFGVSVAIADTNADGKADIAVGAYGEEVSGNADQGRAYVFSGTDGSLLFTLDTPNPQAHAGFGNWVAVGDVNRDGKGDIAVAAFEEDVGGNADQGRAYVFSGADGSLLDRDCDCMPNDYEEAHPCLDPDVPDAFENPDGDQVAVVGGSYEFLNFAEMLADTDACVADSVDDTDSDEFSDNIELFLATDPLDDCPDTLDHDAWPPDLSSGTGCGTHNCEVNVLDVLCFKSVITSGFCDGRYDRRYDLNVDAAINVLDVLLYKPFVNTSCTNP